MTQAELAERLGVTEYTIWRWENGRNLPTIVVLPALCRALGVRPDLFVDLPLREVERYFTD